MYIKICNLLKKYKFEVIFTIICCIFFFILYQIVPMMYDGWAGKFYYNNNNGIISYIKYICTGFYSFINGRIMSNIICGILESFVSEIPLDFFNALVIILIYIFTYKNSIDKSKYNLGLLFFCSLIMIMSYKMRNEVLFYANTAYVVPVLLILVYYNIIKKKSLSKYDLILLSLCGFSIGTWMEHIAVGFASVITLISLYLIKMKKKFNLLIPTLATDLGVLVMFMSPGIHTSRNFTGDKSIILTAIDNFKSLFSSIVYDNINIYIVLAFLFLFYSLYIIKDKKYKIVGIILSSFLVIALIDYKFYFLKSIIDYNNFYILIFYTMLLIVSSIYFILFSKNKLLLLYISFICGFSLAPMLITPNLGYRISSIGYFCTVIIIIIYFLEISSIVNNTKFGYKLLVSTIIVFSFIAFDKTILLEKRIFYVNDKRNEIIENLRIKQELNEWDYDKFVILPLFHENDVIYNGDVQIGSFHYPQFLQANGLDENTKVLFSNSNMAADIKTDNKNIIISVISSHKIDLKYIYIIKYSEFSFDSAIDIDNSGLIDKTEYKFKHNNRKGYYKIEIYSNNSAVNSLIDTAEFYLE